MKKTWKWIIGILIIVVVVAALVTVPMVMRSRMFSNNAAVTAQNQGSNTAPAAPVNPNQLGPGGRNWQRPRMQGNWDQFGGRQGEGRNFNRGMMGNRFMPFGFGFMAIAGLLRLIPLVLFGALLYGMYWLGRRSGLRSQTVVAAPQPVTVAAPVVEPTNDETPII